MVAGALRVKNENGGRTTFTKWRWYGPCFPASDFATVLKVADALGLRLSVTVKAA
jgi:hypothetical protein